MATLQVFAQDDSSLETQSAVWALARDAADATTQYTGAAQGFAWVRFLSAMYAVNRWFGRFDTSALGSKATITGATMNVFGNNKTTNAQQRAMNVYGSTAADSPTTADFDQGGTSAYSDAPITDTAYSSSGYNSWALNAAGLAAILKTGFTKLCMREANFDVANVAPTTDGNIFMMFDLSAQTGTSQDPYLQITYTPGGSTGAPKTSLGGGVSIGPAMGF